MSEFIAQRSTILKAIETANRHEYLPGKFKVDTRSRKILEGVLAKGKPNMNVIQFYRDLNL